MDHPLVRWFFLAQVFSTCFMTGVIWFVQVVHYPLFDEADGNKFSAFAGRHQKWTTWIVGSPMLLEIASAIALIIQLPGAIHAWQAWVGLGLVGIIWASTALLQVPCHDKLRNGYERTIHLRLVQTNWIRTTAWSMRAGLVLCMIAEMLH